MSKEKIKFTAPKIFIGDKEIKDNDIKAIVLLKYAMECSTPRMRKANLDFVLPKYKIKTI